MTAEVCEKLERARKADSIRAIAVNDAYLQAPWADTLYAADLNWWNHHKGVPKDPFTCRICHREHGGWAGPKFSVAPNTKDRHSYVTLLPTDSKAGLGLDRVRQGQNSGYQAVNMAILSLGVRVVLVGFDMRVVENKRHFFGDHIGPGMNKASDYVGFRDRFRGMAADCSKHGIEVLNCTPGSALDCFKPVSLDEVLKMSTIEKRAERDRAKTRAEEIDKYERCYQIPNYRMGDKRMADAVADLKEMYQHLWKRGTSAERFLDIGCGRGEMLKAAREIGFTEAKGVEVVSYLINGGDISYGEAWNLPQPDNSVDVVGSFDMLEHLVPGDEVPTLEGMRRIARVGCLFTANNKDSRSLGEQLHVNKKTYPEWDRLVREIFAGDDVQWLHKNQNRTSETWRVFLR